MPLPKFLPKQIKKLQIQDSVNKNSTFGGVYAWYFPEAQKETLIPLYIGQSDNIYKRCLKHQQGLNYAYKHDVQPAGRHRYKLYYKMKHMFKLVGQDSQPQGEFKILYRFEDGLEKTDKLLHEYSKIVAYYSHLFGFNSPLPAEFWYAKGALNEKDWELVVRGTVSMSKQTIEDYLDLETELGTMQAATLDYAGIQRGQEWLESGDLTNPGLCK